MNATHAFLSGVMAALMPSLVFLGWVLRKAPLAGSPDEPEAEKAVVQQPQ